MRGLPAALLALGAACVIAAPAAAAPPQAEGMVLTTADMPNATVLSQGTTPFTSLSGIHASSAYARTFSGAEIGGTPLISFISSALVATSGARVSTFMRTLVTAIRSKADRTTLLLDTKRSFSATSGLEVRSDGFLRDRTLRTGDAAIEIDFFIKTPRLTFDAGEIYVQVGSALELVIYGSPAPGLTAGQSFALAKLVTARMREASTPPPKETSLPTITGTLSLGQILTAHPGTWSGSQLSYAYQWFRCSSTGGACVAIPSATLPTYTVSTADEGVTLAISVVATDPSGSTVEMSQPTQPIAAPQTP